jgi:AbrB family looped-hinge helix DNA binding protein
MATFKSKLVKWGNSVGVSIPKPVRDALHLDAGDVVELIDKDDYVIIKKANKR